MCRGAPVPVLRETEVLARPGSAGLAALFARLPAMTPPGGGSAHAAPPGSSHWPAGAGRNRSPAGTARIRPAAARTSRDVVLVAALGADPAGDRLRALLADAGGRLIELALLGPTPERIRMRAGEHLLMRLDRGGPANVGHAPDAAIDAIRSAGAVP